jgi:hypothetical protein
MTPPHQSGRPRTQARVGQGRVAAWWSRLTIGLVCSFACSGGLTAPPPIRTATEHLWVFHISGGSYAAHIQMVAIGQRGVQPSDRVFRPLASRAADGTPTNDFAGLAASADDASGLRWTLRRPDGQALRLSYTVTEDTAHGALTLPDGTRYPVVGVRFDSAAAGLVAPPLVPANDGPQPVVLLRLDDTPATDHDFLRRLKARGLVAELAVPTRWVGQAKFLTWDDLAYWRAHGMGIVMHSRHHARTSADEQHFIGEIVGGFAEMKAHGFATHVFVQPGTWADSINFSSPQKLGAWRGALLRTFATVSECYAYGYWHPRAALNPMGLGHVTVSEGVTVAKIRGFWEVAQRPNHATVFLVHTHSLRTKDQLDWFLDLVAAAQARGTVRVVATSQEIFGTTPSAPNSPDVLPDTGSGTVIQIQR